MLRAGTYVTGIPWLISSADRPLGTSHGSPHAYDREVPIVFWGPGIPGGDAGLEARTIDIAPTFAKLLGVAAPADLDGEPLPLE